MVRRSPRLTTPTAMLPAASRHSSKQSRPRQIPDPKSTQPNAESSLIISSAAERRRSSTSTAAELPQLFFTDAAAFRAWMLNQGHESRGVWLQIAKKATMIPSVTYDEAVDEALCCGWIDGQRRSLHVRYFLQRFTPRRPRSLWSQRNVAKVADLTMAGRMLPSGQAHVDAAKADGRWENAYTGGSGMKMPRDFQAALDEKPEAAKVWEGLKKTAQVPFLWRLMHLKKAETRRRKIAELVEMLVNRKM
ncbi:Hypothetical protein R9X50_00438800 [Acrodontium crateriforme]|uniref:Bacteriocin-protection protein n=1 Tax=Acrodontium crateriforme TaxID=150365 RepID=A0AAQ3M487_9PEZI|nr:Hypothetical protein R9X50_00438800 [Acrodontium crateriforme]